MCIISFSGVTTDEVVPLVTEHETDVYVICWPPPQRKQRARSFPVPRGSMATGGCLAKLDLSGSAKKKKKKETMKKIKMKEKMISGCVIQWDTLVFSPYLLLKVILLSYCKFLHLEKMDLSCCCTTGKCRAADDEQLFPYFEFKRK